MATQRVAMINSNNTQKNSDYDFSKITKWLLGNKGGIEASSMFTWDNTSKRLSAGADIATAYVLCTRATSSPIPNQKFLAQFEFTGYLDFLNGTDGDKIFVEIKERLIKDPSLIEDLDSNTSYAQGLGIGEIKIAKNYPSHSNYLPLWEIQGGQAVDKRKVISIPALDEVSQRTTTLEAKVQRAEGKVERLEEGSIPEFLGKSFVVWEKYEINDEMVFNPELNFNDFTEELAIGSSNDNVNIEIPFIHNGGNLTYLDIIAQRVWNMSYWLDCHFYEADIVSVDWTNYFKRRGWLISWSSVWAIDNSKNVVRITPNAPINKPKWTKMVAVVFPYGNIVSSSNYFKTFLNPNLLSESLSPSIKTMWWQYNIVGRKAIYAKSDGFEKTIGKRYYRRSVVNVANHQIRMSASYAWDTEVWPAQFSLRADEKLARIKGRIVAPAVWWDSTFYETQVFLRAGSYETTIELAKFPERQSNVSGWTVEFDFIANVVPWQTYKLILYSSPKRNFHYDIDISVEAMVEKTNAWLIHYPMEVKNIWEKCSFAISGYVNGKYEQQKFSRLLINKTIEGNASAIRYAPSNWLLEIKYKSYQRLAKFDWEPLLSYVDRDEYYFTEWKNYLYVEKWNHKIETNNTDYNRYQSKITLISFIPL